MGGWWVVCDLCGGATGSGGRASSLATIYAGRRGRGERDEGGGEREAVALGRKTRAMTSGTAQTGKAEIHAASALPLLARRHSRHVRQKPAHIPCQRDHCQQPHRHGA
ncbi:hypothetical protein CALVIDRAFT_396606 [Calocera viscosa TUFC12733]|uniref:Uncharacterized protein n=1 Tax=Calocera viscosa (strain TUFC12733) TaxID=1330018 RepID=A0A167PPG6_CALVF|nr:hypothetical protein CALVIDRAFT_396606 [Calocera viscosa TUFC12733]